MFLFNPAKLVGVREHPGQPGLWLVEPRDLAPATYNNWMSEPPLLVSISKNLEVQLVSSPEN